MIHAVVLDCKGFTAYLINVPTSCDRTFKLDIISISLRRNNVLLYGNIGLITLKVVVAFCLKAATMFDLFPS